MWRRDQERPVRAPAQDELMAEQPDAGRHENQKQPLEDHTRSGRRFIPPLMAVAGDRLVERSWFADLLPDFLWIAQLLGRPTDWEAVRSALDVIDRFVPAGSRIV